MHGEQHRTAVSALFGLVSYAQLSEHLPTNAKLGRNIKYSIVRPIRWPRHPLLPLTELSRYCQGWLWLIVLFLAKLPLDQRSS